MPANSSQRRESFPFVINTKSVCHHPIWRYWTHTRERVASKSIPTPCSSSSLGLRSRTVCTAKRRRRELAEERFAQLRPQPRRLLSNTSSCDVTSTVRWDKNLLACRAVLCLLEQQVMSTLLNRHMPHQVAQIPFPPRLSLHANPSPHANLSLHASPLHELPRHLHKKWKLLYLHDPRGRKIKRTRRKIRKRRRIRKSRRRTKSLRRRPPLVSCLLLLLMLRHPHQVKLLLPLHQQVRPSNLFCSHVLVVLIS